MADIIPKFEQKNIIRTQRPELPTIPKEQSLLELGWEGSPSPFLVSSQNLAPLARRVRIMDYVDAFHCLDEQSIISITACLQGRSIGIHFPLPALVTDASTLEADIAVHDSASLCWRSSFGETTSDGYSSRQHGACVYANVFILC